MGVAHPSEVNARFAEGFNQRDVEALLALYDVSGCVVELDGTVSNGPDEVRDHLIRLLEVGGRMVSTNRSAVVADDVALVTAEWSITLDDGGEVRGRSAEVLRRQEDGTWCYLVDQPLAD